MTELKRGIYEHVITRSLADELERMGDAVVQRHMFDPADAHNEPFSS
ncbi:hypothetical protein PVK74_26660 [Micromonospora chalcea]|nr:hypothetical protein [Micromonospora chalcea]WDP99397.1 hypothetical protein PVK74_26660 [Micromonospora chalcea]